METKDYPEIREARTWAEISLSALEGNYRHLRSLAPESKFVGVCKANAYGHGLVTVGQALEKFGADMLAVACLEEAITLREAGVDCPILCLGDTSPRLTHLLIFHNITQTIHNPLQARLFSEQATAMRTSLPVHFKVDTGMGRLGVVCHRTSQAVTTLASMARLDGLFPQGLFTHFARSDEPEGDGYTSTQLDRFQSVINELEDQGIRLALYHCANSGGTLRHPKSHMNMIRPGIALYGYHPDGSSVEGLTPVLTLKSRVASLQQLPAGWSIGYGCTHTLLEDTLVAVLPVGYGDGYARSFSNRMEVVILGVRCPVLGRICMDMTMVNVSALRGKVSPGTVAILYGQEGLLPLGAEQGGTIVYELLCNISGRVPRVVVE